METTMGAIYTKFDEWFATNPVPSNFSKTFFGELIAKFGFDWIVPNPHYDYACTEGNVENPTNYCWNDQIDYYLCRYGGTGGWNTALHNAAKRCDYKALLTYYDALDWYESDLFDGKLADIISAEVNNISEMVAKEDLSELI